MSRRPTNAVKSKAKTQRAKSAGSLMNIIKIIAELNKHLKLHGIDHLVNERYHPLERLLWLALVVAAFLGVFYVGNNQMKRYNANPTVISLERGASMCHKIPFAAFERILN